MKKQLRSFLFLAMFLQVQTSFASISSEEYYLPVLDTLSEFARNPFLQTHFFIERNFESPLSQDVAMEHRLIGASSLGSEVALDEDGGLSGFYALSLGSKIGFKSDQPEPNFDVMLSLLEPEVGLKLRKRGRLDSLHLGAFVRSSLGLHMSSHSYVDQSAASSGGFEQDFILGSSFGPKLALGVGIEARFATWFSAALGVDGVARGVALSNLEQANSSLKMFDPEAAELQSKRLFGTFRPYLSFGTAF